MDRLTHGLFAAFFLAVVLREVGVESDWLVPLHLVVVYLSLVVVASAFRGLRVGDRRAAALFGLQTLLAALIAVAVFRHARVEGFGFSGLSGIYLATIALAVVHMNDRDTLRVSVPYLLGYALLAGVFLYHVLAVSPTSGSALFPVFAAVVLGLSLFVVPRYVEESAFQLSLVTISALLAIVGLAAAIVGEYSIGGFEVAIWNTRSLPLVDIEAPIIQSVFTNPNTLGIVLFPGFVAAVTQCHRLAAERRSNWGLLLIPVVPLLGVALYLTNSRGSMLAAATGLVVYGVYVLAGRRGVPAGVAAGYGCALAALIAVSVLFPGEDGNRLALWSAGLEAFLASPTPLGEGLVGTAELIAPYLSGGGGSVHSSYLSVLLRTGFVGIVGYLVVVVGPTLHAAVRRGRVSPAALALACAFAVHQLFESYTLFQYEFPSVVGALAVGYLIFSLVPETTEAEADRRNERAENDPSADDESESPDS